MKMYDEVRAIPVFGLPEIVSGTNIGRLIADQCLINNTLPCDGDLIVVAQKIVSKSENAVVELCHQTPTDETDYLAQIVGKDPRLVQVILDQSKRVVRAVPGVLIVETHHGFICANAGVDQSNIQGDQLVTTLPVDSDRSAELIRGAFLCRTGRKVGVVISDTFNRPWREGSINVAIGIAGFDPLKDLRGTKDDFNRDMTTSVVSLADEVASMAQLVMGEAGRVPAAIVRGVEWKPGDYSKTRLLRPANRDLFR
ncbi:MAG: coenzyme F420-0:L-glutamate ligase [SAR202 cluster bacterium]|nr:coenzyme F420-0:L-glutamate ligase [SAR202 cluster bacterium]|tara:strand:+ start:192 stop:953 length:762 start_codon:yes stop_codon:yes gene_type:complete